MKRPATRRTLQLLLVLVAALTWNVGNAEAVCGTYTLYRHIYTPQGATSACSALGCNWVNGNLTATTNVCPNIAEVVRDTFDCETNALKSTNSAAALICPCDPNPANAISLGGQGTLAAMPKQHARRIDLHRRLPDVGGRSLRRKAGRRSPSGSSLRR